MDSFDYGGRVHVVAIGDIGPLDGMFHVGDEAMFDELVFQLRARGVSPVVGLSSNPMDSRGRYGIDAIAPIGFGGRSRAEQEARLARVLDDPASLPADDPAHAVIAAVRSSRGVVIAGGGNLASTWPLHVFERAALGELARRAGVPLVVSGQTIGPALVDDDRARIAALLGSAALVGVREPTSAALVASWGIPATATVDDASFLPDRPAAAAGSGAAAPPAGPAPAAPYALVTVPRHSGDLDPERHRDAVAALLDRVHAETGAVPLFSAHFGPLDDGPSRGDELVHDAIRARMSAPSAVERVRDSARSAALARGAELVVTGRYHPAVFAVSGGVPTIGLAVDEYTRVKLSGALGNVGQASVLTGAEPDARVRDLLAGGRDGIRGRGVELAARRRAESTRWWDRVAETLGA